jgi:mRNA interferase MazF
MQKGEIFWAKLDPVVGSETAKTRPVLIVSNDINNQYGATVTVLPVTSSTAKIYPFEVSLEANESGLRNESKVKANQIRTIDKSRLGNKIGQLNSAKMKAVELAILIHLDIF